MLGISQTSTAESLSILMSNSLIVGLLYAITALAVLIGMLMLQSLSRLYRNISYVLLIAGTVLLVKVGIIPAICFVIIGFLVLGFEMFRAVEKA